MSVMSCYAMRNTIVFTILYYTILYYTILYYTILYILYYALLLCCAIYKLL